MLRYAMMAVLGSALMITTALAGPMIPVTDSDPAAETPAGVVVAFVRNAHAGAGDVARTYCAPAYLTWLEGVGGVDAFLARFETDDLAQLFAYNVREQDDDSARIKIRLWSTTSGQARHVTFNLSRGTGGWQIVK